jgi:hypothetical protein
MPYTTENAPDYVKRQVAGKRLRQWVDVWNSAYARALRRGEDPSSAEGSAFAQAHAVAGVHRQEP